MNLPHILKDEHDAHFVILLLTVVNSLLIILVFFLLIPSSKRLQTIFPISAQTPIVDFNIVSPKPNSTVAGTIPLVTTLTNGPKIVVAQLFVDSQKVQEVTSQETDKLTLYWDTTKFSDGKHRVEIRVQHAKEGDSQVTTNLIVQNIATRSISSK